MKAFIRWTLFTISIASGIFWLWHEPVYTPQDSYKTREYYPAIVVDKRTYQSCSKNYGCDRECVVNLELDDSDILKNIYLATSNCAIYNLGDTIRLERHVTDPKARLSLNYHYIALISWIVFAVFGVVYVLVESVAETGDKSGRYPKKPGMPKF